MLLVSNGTGISQFFKIETGRLNLTTKEIL